MWLRLFPFIFAIRDHDLKLILHQCSASTGQSEELKDLLRNPHLRQLIQEIDAADSKGDAMKAAMQEPLFVEFSDQCLKVVENNEYNEI